MTTGFHTEDIYGVDPRLEQYAKRLRMDREKDNLDEILRDPDNLNLKNGISMMTTQQLMDSLARFTIKDNYPDNLRALFYFTNEELTHRNIAPVWREIVKVKYTDPDKLSNEIKRYYCDIQIIDLQWIHAKHHGHRVANTAWENLYEHIFVKELFDIKQADNIANAGFKVPEKLKGMKLNSSMQLQLSILRSDTIKKRVFRAMLAAAEVEMHIHDAAYMNPRKGKKVSAQAEVWAKLWLCRKLAGSSPKNISDMYTEMTGQNINLSVLRNKLTKIAAALEDVNSPYLRDMIIKR